MNSTTTSDALNRLYAIHYRSLPSYLRYAKPYSLRGDEAAKETLDQIALDHEAMVTRIGDLLVISKVIPDSDEYPMEFTFYHDLGYDFLVRKVIEHQVQDIAVIEQCVEQLSLAPLAKALAEECLGEAKGHLDSLRELAEQTTA